MSRSHLRSIGMLEHSLIHELRPGWPCARRGTDEWPSCAASQMWFDEVGITDTELEAALRRRGYPGRRAWVAVHRWSWLLGKEAQTFRVLDRRRHRKLANRLTRMERDDEIVPPRRTSGWQTW